MTSTIKRLRALSYAISRVVVFLCVLVPICADAAPAGFLSAQAIKPTTAARTPADGPTQLRDFALAEEFTEYRPSRSQGSDDADPANGADEGGVPATRRDSVALAGNRCVRTSTFERAGPARAPPFAVE